MIADSATWNGRSGIIASHAHCLKCRTTLSAGLPIERWGGDDTNSPQFEEALSTARHITARDPNGHVKTFERAWFGGVSAAKEYQVAVPSCATALPTPASVTRFERAPWGDVSGITDSLGAQVRLTYDLLGRATEVREPGLGVFKTVYDSRGNPIRREMPGGTKIEQRFDSYGRITARYVNGRRLATYRYDDLNNVGRLAGILEPSGQELFKYTNIGQLGTIDYKVREGLLSRRTLSIGLTYDIDGNVETVTYPNGAVARYSYELGRVHNVTFAGTELFAVTAQGPDGQPTSIRLGNGVVEERAYDSLGRVRKIVRTPRSGIAHEVEIARDPVGNPTRVSVDSRALFEASYDGLDRIDTVIDPIGRVTFQYDGGGNILQTSRVGTYINGQPPTTVHPHATTRAGNERVRYNDVGSATSAGDTGISMGTAGERALLVSPKQISELQWSPDGGVRTISRGIERRLLLGDYVQCVAASCQSRVFGPADLFADQDSKSGVMWYGHGSTSGTLETVSDPLGRLLSQSLYSIAGQSLNAVTTQREEVWLTGFAGLLAVPGEPLAVAGPRPYSKVIGRFLAADSMIPSGADPQLLNRYTYAKNSPLRFNDRDGRQYVDWSTSYYYGGYSEYYYSSNFDQQMFFTNAESYFGQVGVFASYSDLSLGMSGVQFANGAATGTFSYALNDTLQPKPEFNPYSLDDAFSAKAQFNMGSSVGIGPQVYDVFGDTQYGYGMACCGGGPGVGWDTIIGHDAFSPNYGISCPLQLCSIALGYSFQNYNFSVVGSVRAGFFEGTYSVSVNLLRLYERVESSIYRWMGVRQYWY